MTWIEPWPPLWKAVDCPPELWHGNWLKIAQPGNRGSIAVTGNAFTSSCVRQDRLCTWIYTSIPSHVFMAWCLKFPVRYELNFYINLLRNSVFKGLSTATVLLLKTFSLSVLFAFIRNAVWLLGQCHAESSSGPGQFDFTLHSQGEGEYRALKKYIPRNLMRYSVRPTFPIISFSHHYFEFLTFYSPKSCVTVTRSSRPCLVCAYCNQ
jgi:hypothetical protein